MRPLGPVKVSARLGRQAPWVGSLRTTPSHLLRARTCMYTHTHALRAACLHKHTPVCTHVCTHRLPAPGPLEGLHSTLPRVLTQSVVVWCAATPHPNAITHSITHSFHLLPPARMSHTRRVNAGR